NNPALELMMGIDTNHTSGTGTRALPDVLVAGSTVGISVTADAAWGDVVDARFPTNGSLGVATTNPRIYTDLNTSAACGGTCGAQLASNAGNFAELSIPW